MSSPVQFGFSTGFADIGSIGSTLFGDKEKSSANTTISESSTRDGRIVSRDKLNVDRAAIDKIISDILGSNEGLAAILTEEQGAGLFKSTVAQDAVGELIAKVAGEIAKLTGERVQSQDIRDVTSRTAVQKTKSKSESEGLIGKIF